MRLAFLPTCVLGALLTACSDGDANKASSAETTPVATPPTSTAAAAISETAVPVSEPAIDARTGLIVAEGWEMAAAHCGACHSYRLVTAQRGDADYWRDIIRWMQRTQNLWQIPEEERLIAYLGANYDESEWGRRPPLAPALLPAVASTP